MELDLRKRSTLDHFTGGSAPHRRVALWIAIAINVVLFMAMAVDIVDMSNLTAGTLIRWGAAALDGELWRVVSANFVHVSLFHLFDNMLVLVLIGRLVEGAHGTRAFTVVYLASGIAGTIASILNHPNAVVAGASAAVCGCMGAVFVSTIRRWSSIDYKARTSVFLWTTVVAANAILMGAMMRNVSGIGHAVGFAAGIVCGLFLPSDRSPGVCDEAL